MPRKPLRPDSDIQTLADELRARKQGDDGIDPWMRRNVARLTRMVRERGWRLDDVGRALTLAGITYGSGRPWSGQLLAVKMSQARAQLRARKDTRGEHREEPPPASIPEPAVQRHAWRLRSEPASSAAVPAPAEGGKPKFALAQLANRHGALPQPARSRAEKPPPTPEPEADVDAVMKLFFRGTDNSEE